MNKIIWVNTKNILSAINGKSYVVQICRECNLSFNYTSRILTYLEEQKLILFLYDGRRKIPNLTKDGEKVLINLCMIQNILKR